MKKIVLLLVMLLLFTSCSSESSYEKTDVKKEFTLDTWPKGEVSKLITKPKDKKVYIGWQTEDGFYLEVSESDAKFFKDYVKDCYEKGFNLEYTEGNDYFYSKNIDGFDLSLNRNEDNIMTVILQKLSLDEPEETKEKLSTLEKENTETVKTNSTKIEEKKVTKNTQEKKIKDSVIEIDFEENIIFSKYDVKVFLDNKLLGTAKHGELTTFNVSLSKGNHNLKFEDNDDLNITNNKSFDIEKETYIYSTISSKSDTINIDIKNNTLEDYTKVLAERKQNTNETQDINKDKKDEEIITTKNSNDFKKLVNLSDETDDYITEFSEKYYDRIVEFNGRVDDIMNFKNFTMYFDVLVAHGDFDPDSVKGPAFQFHNVNSSDLGLEGRFLDQELQVGDNVKIKARLGEYSKEKGIYRLEPISVKKR